MTIDLTRRAMLGVIPALGMAGPAFAQQVPESPVGSAVPDGVIVESMQLLAETEGIFAETAGGVTVGVLRQLVREGTIKPDDVTVAYITGNGLKTQEAVEGVVRPITIEPSLKSFEDALKARA